jgi:hypothetical protein
MAAQHTEKMDHFEKMEKMENAAAKMSNVFTCGHIAKPELTTQEILALKRMLCAIKPNVSAIKPNVCAKLDSITADATAVEISLSSTILPNQQEKKAERKLQFDFDDDNLPTDANQQYHSNLIQKPTGSHIEIRTVNGTIVYFVGKNILQMKFNSFKGFVSMGMQILKRKIRLIYNGKQFESEIDNTMEELGLTNTKNVIFMVLRM